jgi:Cu+-exporting ATPase
MRLAASAESGSEHPLAKAIVNYAIEVEGIKPTNPDLFQSISGEGIYCTVEGSTIVIGNRQFMNKNNLAISTDAEEMLQQFEKEGKTAIMVGVDGVLAGVIGIADQVKVVLISIIH